MSKELETLEKLLAFAFVMSENMVGLTKGNYNEDTFIKKTYEYLHKYNVDLKSKIELEKAIQRLEAIDNANPSEALKDLECVGRWKLSEDYVCDTINESDEYDTIKQALIKAQEQEKVLNIITKKNIDIFELKISKKVEKYNAVVKRPFDTLTEEEFNLLKRYFKYE